MTPHELLDAAKDLMQPPGASLDGIWPRAAALLVRQALEAAMAKLWAANCQAGGLSAATMRSQELCLTAYLDPGPARRAAYLFAALSRAAFVGEDYELSPVPMRHNESDRREVRMAKHPLIGYLIWLVLFGAVFAWEGLALARVTGVPSLSDVFRVIMRYPVGRWALFAFWLWAGWHFFIRGWHFLLRA